MNASLWIPAFAGMTIVGKAMDVPRRRPGENKLLQEYTELSCDCRGLSAISKGGKFQLLLQ